MDPHNPDFPKYPPFHTITNNFPPYEAGTQRRAYASEGYGMSGKIMLCAIIILFIVVVIIVGLHIYARWFLTRSRQRQHHHRRRHRRTHLVFTMDISPATSAINRGLDPVILKSLPTFSYSSTSHDPAMECAVCLSEFEDNEKGRLLPKCNHSFHTECIDMWFKSHSTCPLCRAPVNSLPPPTPVTPGQITIDSRESEPGSSSRASQGDDERSSVGPFEFTSPSTSSSSSSSETPNLATTEVARRKFEVSIEIPPRRNESFKNMEEDGQLDSLSGRIRSFKRMLSRDKRPVPSPSPRSRGHIIELDLERGHGDEHRVITPRPYQNSESTTTTPR